MIWQPHEIQFLRDNHRTMSPKDMTVSLNRPYQSIIQKMLKLDLKVMSVIHKEQQYLLMERLVKLNMHVDDIVEVTGLYKEFVNRYFIAKSKSIQSSKAPEPEIINSTDHFECIVLLKRKEYANYQPSYPEDERFKYKDLSPSEKVIYHGLVK